MRISISATVDVEVISKDDVRTRWKYVQGRRRIVVVSDVVLSECWSEAGGLDFEVVIRLDAMMGQVQRSKFSFCVLARSWALKAFLAWTWGHCRGQSSEADLID